MPKNSKVNKYKFASFPKSLTEVLKAKCHYKEQESNSSFYQSEELYDREFLKLNRLEAYILKLVIPFIRIAHCPKGPYLKLKGDLILITADLVHSLNKVLPVEQNLIPVSFKRKLVYSGSYIEEYVEKDKLMLYFNWFKSNNHLFEDVVLDSELIEQFENESLVFAQSFENNATVVIEDQ